MTDPDYPGRREYEAVKLREQLHLERERGYPGTGIYAERPSLTAALWWLAAEQPVTLTVEARPDVASKRWWTLTVGDWPNDAVNGWRVDAQTLEWLLRKARARHGEELGQ